jgi:4-aminobutyrate aminotransferase-like enzyme
MAGAAAYASVSVIEDEGLVENSERVGAWMLERLQNMQERHEFMGHVQGKGMLIGVELVKDRGTREPLDREVCVRIFQACLRRGLIGMAYSPHIRVNPALTIDQPTAETALGLLDEALEQVEREGHWR